MIETKYSGGCQGPEERSRRMRREFQVYKMKSDGDGW